MGKGGCIPPVGVVEHANNAPKTSTGRRNSRDITIEDLSAKTSIDECWIAYDGGVYDVTHWLAKHPGGIRAIMSAAGSDATSVMKSLHAPNTLEVFMKRIRKVGTLVAEDEATVSTAVIGAGNENKDKKAEAAALNNQDDAGPKNKKRDGYIRNQAIHKEFDALSQRLMKEGWYTANPLDYWAPILRCAVFLGIGVKAVLWSQESGTLLEEYSILKNLLFVFGSILFGMFFQNIAFMGHDAGHGSVTGNFKHDLLFGFFVGNAFAGIDVGWWKSSHYVHHSATNSLHDDPDIQHMPLLCFDERMGDNRWSTYHGRYMPFDAIGRAVIPYQHWYFYPVMAVARVNLYLQSILYLIHTCPLFGENTKAGKKIIDDKTGKVREKYAWPKPTLTIWSLSVLSLGFFWTMMYLFFSQLDVMPAIICFAVSHFTAGILHVQILLSHVAMHYCADGHGTTEAVTVPNGNDQAGYFEWQALSTMDVDCPPWMDWFHGGLQFQLEHHLFPRVPRWRLRELCALTDEIFAKYDVPVVRIPFIEANKMILSHMATVGANVVKMKSL
eukprot:CAMPEP_0204638878 /NCGR_PEP_ID=MMETSP0717-20131115/40897_1 /ASSEMBLY_ACC=CAM_ASM_000666 /TAXON_ID=230516 /ORGANISM="Chaetoceros curvisetus" /LENGTH=554 /DNA_ID=CAMNT_0051658781 /DNA_START=20 /DNA_END=1684 /DNA_ORIENTATION=+